jgi:hypothetical protein
MRHNIIPNKVLPDKVIASAEDRGTSDDPAWGAGDYTGGNDSGTSRIQPGTLDKAQGPDRTAETLEGLSARDLLNNQTPAFDRLPSASGKAQRAGTT